MNKVDQTYMTLYYHYIHELCNSFNISLTSLLPSSLPNTIFRNLSLFCHLLGQPYRPLNTLLISSGLKKWWTRKTGPYFGCPPNGPKPFKIYVLCNPNVSRGSCLHAVEKRPKQNQFLVPVRETLSEIRHQITEYVELQIRDPLILYILN